MAGCKVLFIQKDIEGAEPIGALYVAACLRAAGHECRFTGTRGVDKREHQKGLPIRDMIE